MLNHSYYALFFLVFCITAFQNTAAQTIGTCALPEAKTFLNVGNVQAGIYNGGNLFYDSEPNQYAEYVVPKGGEASGLFSAAFWVGGLVDEELRVAGSAYGNRGVGIGFDFWAGPIEKDGTPPSDCAAFDRIYQLTNSDIKIYETQGNTTDRLRDWPWHLGAPVVDGDGDPDNYNLAGGDRPALLGDQMFWWVMNDLGNEHLGSGTPPIGLEVRVSAFAFDGMHETLPPEQTSGFLKYLANTTFYRYEIIYRGHAPLEDAFFGIWTDIDLGASHDEYVGSDTTLDLAYVYNADNFDAQYGENPPALGYTVLRGATTDDGEILGMERFRYNVNGVAIIGDPADGEAMYNTLRGYWNDGLPQTIGGFGRSGTEQTFFAFPAEPGEYWSAGNSDGNGTALTPGNWKMALSTGPVTLEPGERQEFAFGIVWSQGTDHLDSVRQLKEDTERVRAIYPSILRNAGLATDREERPVASAFSLANHPNPFSQQTTIRYQLTQPGHVRLAVYDLLGREVVVLVDAAQPAATHEATFEAGSLPSGVYYYQLRQADRVVTMPMLLAK